MAKSFSKFIPAFIPLFFELFRQYKRSFSHDGNIRKSDKTAEKIATVEHMLVRLEKKIQMNRETYEKIASRILTWLAINSIILIAVAIKIFFY